MELWTRLLFWGHPVYIIKYVIDLLVIPLTKLINQVIRDGIFPSCLGV
jgi:hypothetical protein